MRFTGSDATSSRNGLPNVPVQSPRGRFSESLLTNARLLRHLAGVIFRQGVTYRLEWLFGILSGILALWIQVAVWQVLLGSGGPAASSSPVNAATMVTYLVVVRMVSTIVTSNVSREMESRLRTGDIADDLLQPTGLPVLMLGQSLGQTAAALLNRTLPVAILAQLIWGLHFRQAYRDSWPPSAKSL